MDASAQLAAVARALRAAGAGAAQRRVVGEIQRATPPLAAATRAAALDRLPKSGGLAARVAAERVTVSARADGVTLTNTAHDAATTNSGYVLHPTYGHGPLVRQDIPEAAGWWTDTMRDSSRREVAPRVERAARDIAAEIQRGTLL